MTDPEPVLMIERDGPIALLTLNRPQAMNAISSALSAAIGAALEEVNDDATVRAVVLTGAGRAFCAGADLKEIAAGRSTLDVEHPEWGFAGFVRHYVDTPVIAAVNGYALGGGTELMLACDLAVIDANAALGLPEVARGLFAAAGGVLRLHHQIPPKIAAEVVLAGRRLSAEEALNFGLVNSVSPAGECLAAALELAARVADGAPLATRASKRLMQTSAGFGGAWASTAWDLNNELRQQVFTSADAVEGALAFVGKRTPTWVGH